MKLRIVTLFSLLMIVGLVVVACVAEDGEAQPTLSPSVTVSTATGIATLTPTSTVTEEASATPTGTPVPPTDTLLAPTTNATPTERPTATASATATLVPPTPTDTRAPTETPTWTVTPGAPGPLPTGMAVNTPDLSLLTPGATMIPTPVPLVELPQEAVNILLLGSDTSQGSGLTDTMIVVSVDPRTPSVSMLSIPRDMYVFIPGWKMSRINTAYNHGLRVGYPGGGPGLLKATIEYNLGIRVHYYAHVDFEGYIRLIDTLGGVDVVVDCELHDTFPDPEAEGGQTDIDLMPGVHHLEGKMALWYARSRWSTTDYDRARRQQRVLRGMWAQIKQLGLLGKVPELWEGLTQAVDTDLSLEDVLWLASVASRLDTDTAITSRFIDGTVLQPWLTPEGAQVQLPIYDLIGPLVVEALTPPETNRARQGLARVEVLNGTTWPEWGILVADRLAWEGFLVTRIGQADRVDYQSTLVLNHRGTTKGSSVYWLARILRMNWDNILPVDPPSEEVDFSVVVGYDFVPCYKSYWYNVHITPTPTPEPTAAP
jgi:LCP family protein required for cell wall assembly